MKSLVICVVLFSLATFAAQAKLLPSYRMDSAAFLSDTVVLCKEDSVQIAEVSHGTWTERKTVVHCTTMQVFKGDIKSGSSFSVEYESVFRRCLFDKQGYMETDPTGKGLRVVPPEYLPAGRALLFLKKTKDADSYSIVTAKLIQPDAIYRFVQFMNPGPLILCSQDPENIKLPIGQRYGEHELIQDLLIALEKSASLKESDPKFY